LNVVSGYIPDIYHQPRVLGYVLGKKLLYAVAFEDRRLVVIDADSNHIITSIGLGGEPRAICYIPGHNLIACAVTGLDGLFAIDCSTHTITGFIPTPHEPVSLLYNPLQDRLYCSAGHLESLWVINPALLRIEKSIPTDGVIQAMTFDSTVNRIYATSGWPAKVIFIDCCRDSLIASISLPTYPLGEIVLHPEERRVYVGLPALSAIGVIKDTLPVSIAEQPSISGMAKTLPTIVRGVLPLSRDINTHSQITLVDISGRKVLTLHPGANDLSHLARGVYFIKEKNGIKMKVVIAR
jgi:DNA-binding beta-propeller fold protein YncE